MNVKRKLGARQQRGFLSMGTFRRETHPQTPQPALSSLGNKVEHLVRKTRHQVGAGPSTPISIPNPTFDSRWTRTQFSGAKQLDRVRYGAVTPPHRPIQLWGQDSLLPARRQKQIREHKAIQESWIRPESSSRSPHLMDSHDIQSEMEILTHRVAELERELAAPDPAERQKHVGVCRPDGPEYAPKQTDDMAISHPERMRRRYARPEGPEYAPKQSSGDMSEIGGGIGLVSCGSSQRVSRPDGPEYAPKQSSGDMGWDSVGDLASGVAPVSRGSSQRASRPDGPEYAPKQSMGDMSMGWDPSCGMSAVSRGSTRSSMMSIGGL